MIDGLIPIRDVVGDDPGLYRRLIYLIATRQLKAVKARTPGCRLARWYVYPTQAQALLAAGNTSKNAEIVEVAEGPTC